MRFSRSFVDSLITVANLALIAITPLLFQRFTPLPLWACILLGVLGGIVLFWLVLFGLRFANVTFLTLTPLLLMAITPLHVWARFVVGIPGGLIISLFLQYFTSRLFTSDLASENAPQSVI